MVSVINVRDQRGGRSTLGSQQLWRPSRDFRRRWQRLGEVTAVPGMPVEAFIQTKERTAGLSDEAVHGSGRTGAQGRI